MLGFLVGVGSLIGLAALKHRRCGGAHWHGHHHGHGPGGRWRRRPLWLLFERLDTTPGQEKVIREELERLWDHADLLRKAGRGAGDDLAQALRGESLDEATADQVLARHEGALVEVRKQVARSLARVHEALDPQQRARLARFLSRRAWHGPPFGGPYRGWM